MNLALVAGVAALLVLLLVMRRKTADGGSTPKPTGASKVKPAKPAKSPRATKVKAAKPPKARRERGRRGRRGAGDAPPAPQEPMPLGATTSATADDASGQVTSEFGLPTAPAPGEPDWDAMRAAMNGTAAPAAAEPQAETEATQPAPQAQPAPVAPAPVGQGMQEGWSDAELITAPGWPLPGDIEGGGWEDAGEPATIGGAAATVGGADEPAAGEWLGQTTPAPAAADVPDDPAPVAEDADGAMWAEDPLTTWKAAQDAQADEPVAETPAEADGPWLGGGDAGWGTPADDPSPDEATAAPAWDAPAPVAEDVTPAPAWNSQAPAAEEPAWGASGWDAPAFEPESADPAPEAPSTDWAPAEPVTAIGEPSIDTEAPSIGGWAAEAEPSTEGAWSTPEPEPVAIGADPVPAADEAWDAAWQTASADTAAESWDAPAGEAWTGEETGAELVGAGAESAATLAPEAPIGIGGWAAIDDDPPVAPAAPAGDWPAADPDDAWAAALAQAQPDAAPPEPVAWDEPEVEVPAEVPAFVAERLPEAPAEAPAAVEVAETVPAEPLAFAGQDDEPPALDTPPTAPEGAGTEAPAEPAAEAPAGDGLAWWDDPDPDTLALAPGERPVWLAGMGEERYTGRWSLGGMALQAGHQALTGVSFRQPVEDAPRSWTLPTRQRPDAGTLVLVVEATMNCEVGDITVLTEDGFAPNREGFTMTLRAGATGPFAASGTFRLMR